MAHIDKENLPEDFVAVSTSDVRFIPFRLKPGADVYKNLVSIAQEYQVTAGEVIKLLGTVKKVRIGFFNTAEGKFKWNDYNNKEGYELTSGQGTIALENGALKPHIHITFAERKNNLVHGGHLDIGTIVKEYVEGTIIQYGDIYAVRKYELELNASPLKLYLRRDF